MPNKDHPRLSRRTAILTAAALLPLAYWGLHSNRTQLQGLDPAATNYRSTPTPRTFIVENFAHPTDTSEDRAWQRAVDALKTAGGRGIIQGASSTYKFDRHVNLNGVVAVTLQGMGQKQTVIRGTGKGTSPIAAFYVPRGPGTDIEHLLIQDLGLDGEMTSTHTGHARHRTFRPGNIRSLLDVSGNLVPTEPNNRAVRAVHIRRVDLVGTENLAIRIRGVDRSTLERSALTRCLDPGWTHSREVIARNNVSRWSADNGLSISRGCTDFTVANNYIEGAFFSGIHVGGFAGEAGPSNGMIHDNTIINSGIRGISAALGPQDLHITGNTINGVLRGVPRTEWRSDANQVGVGILISGMLRDHRPTNVPASVKFWARNIEVSRNVVKGAERWGIMFHSVRGLTISNNKILNPGVARFLDGRSIVSNRPSYSYRNIGIGVFALSKSLSRDVRVTDNAIVDDRRPKLMTYGVYAGSKDVIVSGNNIIGQIADG